MEISQIRANILSDDTFVEKQLEKFRVYYGLKHTIRWGLNRDELNDTESVAEHVYGMHVLCQYFLPLEDDLDPSTLHAYITWHDMAEAVTGDMTTRTKTDSHKDAEKQAETRLSNEAPSHLQSTLSYVYESYDAKATPEAQFVKALDKVEPMFHLWFVCQKHDTTPIDLGWSAKEYKNNRHPYTKAFPLVQRFDDVISKTVNTTPYFPENR